MSYVEGIDVSEYNAADYSGDLDFQFARAGYGVTRDSGYRHHTEYARSRGWVTGGYWFGTNRSGSEQAAAFLSAAGSVHLRALDLEYNGANTMTNVQAAEFIAYVQATGQKCGLYHSQAGFPKLGQDFDWIANWSVGHFPSGAEFWQYHGHPLDRNRFNGARAGLLNLAGVHPPQEYTVSINGPVVLYDGPGGTKVGAVTRATYVCTRSMVNGLWWYQILTRREGSPTASAGRSFKPNRFTKAVWA